jgi:hypothetical protein
MQILGCISGRIESRLGGTAETDRYYEYGDPIPKPKGRRLIFA